LLFECVLCSFQYEVDRRFDPPRANPAPVHPVHSKTGRINWKMCAGSGQAGNSVVREGRSLSQGQAPSRGNDEGTVAGYPW
jgi:hypothetical protein